VKGQSFEGLTFYQDSLKLLRATYRFVEALPDFERFNLASQLRRSALSVPLNIAEAYGRYHYLDRLRFLYIARGSVSETLSGFVAAETLGYCSQDQLEWNRDLCNDIEKNLNGYCRSMREQQQGRSEFGTQYIVNDPLLDSKIAESLIQYETQVEITHAIPDIPIPD
jgi:four helix bundle protein